MVEQQMNSGVEPDEALTVQRLRRLRQMVEEARTVPMSASCMVNRAEVLALIDEALADLPRDLELSRSVITEQYNAHASAREKAAEIIEHARAEAQQLVSVSQVAAQANEYAAEARRAALEEADQIRVEADMYVDTRLAEFEASLQKTVGQVATMRQRLSQRSGLDASQVQALPAIE
ncbi:MAG: hypothetical protein Q4G45_02470 [Actinomycetia bacterium]|nr:hypothetical protein [Actinomycetes bacterium]